MRLSESRSGDEVRVRERSIPYSLWPVGRGTRREKMQPVLFATDPWFLIQGAVDDLQDASARTQAEALRRQAQEFYYASKSANVDAAKPLLFYYCLLNLAKCFVVVKSGLAITGRISHGLSEHLPITPGAFHGEVSFNPTNMTGAFQLFARYLGQTFPTPVAPATNLRMRSQDFLSQILVGHRMFCSAENFIERFVSVEKIEYLTDSNIKNIWLKARFEKQDVKRLGYYGGAISTALSRSRDWRNVISSRVSNQGADYLDFELMRTFSYSQRPSETLNEISAIGRSTFWQLVSSHPPYRKYYVYVNASTKLVIHQLLSMYVSAFYFGSITRYKPEGFAEILGSKIGPFVHEFLDNQQSQFLYLLASELLEQEISKAAVV